MEKYKNKLKRVKAKIMDLVLDDFKECNSKDDVCGYRERIKEKTLDNPIIMKPEKCKFTTEEKKLKKILENVCHKDYRVANKTYSFRKWLYLKVFKLKVCHFCLCDSWDYYCSECARETL